MQELLNNKRNNMINKVIAQEVLKGGGLGVIVQEVQLGVLVNS